MYSSKISFIANKLDTLHETDKFLETSKLPKLTQEEKNLSRSITSKEIGSIIKNLPTKKVQNQMGSLVNSIKYLKN